MAVSYSKHTRQQLLNHIILLNSHY